MNLIKRAINFLMDCLETITFVGSIYIVIYIFLFMPTEVRGASMEPTLHNGDRLIISKITYKLRRPERGDIIVIYSPKNPEVEYIKRLIGVPGDKILIEDGNVYINNNQMPDDFISAKTNENISLTVPDNYVYVMGDNRPRSSDSREFGPVPISSIVGVVPLRYLPFDKSTWFNNPLPANFR